jgi:hypothetical protein
MILLVSVAIALLLSEAVVAASSTSTDQILTFLLLGDWGKGGTSGNYGKKDRRALAEGETLGREMESEREGERKGVREGMRESATRRLEDNKDDKDNNKDQDQEQKLHQMEVAVAMGNYSREASPKPSFLVALG